MLNLPLPDNRPRDVHRIDDYLYIVRYTCRDGKQNAAFVKREMVDGHFVFLCKCCNREKCPDIEAVQAFRRQAYIDADDGA